MMAKRKRNIEILSLTGIPLPLSNPEIPDEWLPENDFSSHRPMLYRVITNTAHSAFFEFGTGYGSTPLLKEYYRHWREKDFVSYENNSDWFQKMITDEYQSGRGDNTNVQHGNHYLGYYENLLSINIWKGSIVFIDCAPAELRKELICKHAGQGKILIVHDTEPGAEYVYGLSEILNSFKFRCDLIIDGFPQTTAVSNLYQFENWKTIINDQIKFI